MPAVVDLLVPVRRLSPAQDHCFFGYYDIPAVDAVGHHLCHRVGFRDRFPTSEDAATLGWLDLQQDGRAGEDASRFHAFAETHAWNFQQGSMLQWLPGAADTCVYNLLKDGSFGSCAHNVRTGEQRRFPLSFATVSRDGAKALCINMARVYAFRRGYGYAGAPDPFADVAVPEQDGVWFLDLVIGSTRLILSLAETVRFLERSGESLGGCKVVVNHITWNPSASRFMFLLRTFPNPQAKWENWRTFLITADSTGGDLRNHPVWDYASHYFWRDDATLLVHLKPGADQHGELVLLNDVDGSRTLVDPAYFRADGHCSYSPDGRWILYDSYPDESTPDCLRSLQVYSVDRHEGFTLGRFRSEACVSAGWDLRCDLHPRGMPDGHGISFDSIHEGYRGVYWADLRELTKPVTRQRT